MTPFRGLFLSLLLICQYVGLVLFLKGFFPIKKAIPGSASLSDLPPEPGLEGSGHPIRPVVDRLVVVMIDALRADFVLPGDDRMEYVNQLIRNNETLSFHAKAHPPTVTMPRIKALVTGSIPGFVDVILNSFSSALQEDNLLAQLKAAGKQMVFFGDDTWIKLFPHSFKRSDGTTSFFVTDYTEVDNNVTRHLDKELGSTDWDVMILHYLGLDHIGHLAGPSSPLIGPKLKEMDDVIKNIHRNLIRWDKERGTHSAMVICGDHGMSDSGSHGGASFPEMSTPLVFVSSQFQGGKGARYTELHIDQIDLVSSLAVLLGTAIPQNSIGSLIPQLLRFYTSRERLRAFQVNAHQLSKVLITNGHLPDDVWELGQATRLHKEWLKSFQEGTQQNTASLDISAEQIAKQYSVALKTMSNKVAGSLSCYDLHAMASGIAILLQVLFWVLYAAAQSVKVGETWRDCLITPSMWFVLGLVFLAVLAAHLTVCSSATLPGTCSSDTLCSDTTSALFFSSTLVLLSSASLGGIIFLLPQATFTRLPTVSSQLRSVLSTPSKALLALGTAFHVLSLLSSSFVEEEHQTWYFLTISYFVWSGYDSIRRAFREAPDICSENEERAVELSRESEFPDEKVKRNYRRYNLRSHGMTNNMESDGISENETLTRPEKEQSLSDRHSVKRCITSLLVTFLFLVTLRVSRSLNQTGIKWADQPDISDFLVKPECKLVLSLVAVTSMVLIVLFSSKRKDLVSLVLIVSGLVSVFFYRTATGSLTLPWIQSKPITDGLHEARFTFCCSIALLVCCVIRICKALSYKEQNDEKKQFTIYRDLLVDGIDTFLMALIVVEALLLRIHNIALLAVFTIQENYISRHSPKSSNSHWSLVLLHYWLGQAMYFALGNSNSLATVDLAAGYIGMRSHDTAVFALLGCLATYGGPLLWLTSLIKHLVKNSTSSSVLCSTLYQACVTLSLPQSFLLCVYCTLAYGQRYHLFVWSVFSPKLLKEVIRSLVMFISTIVILVFTSFITRGEKFQEGKDL